MPPIRSRYRCLPQAFFTLNLFVAIFIFVVGGGMAQVGGSELIEVKVGEDFEITLESNPTTGYGWQLGERVDESIVRFLGRDYRPAETELLGAGGKEIWRFKAVGPGRTTLELLYMRPWEKGVPPIKRATFVITVR